MQAWIQWMLSIGIVLFATAIFLPRLLRAVKETESEAERLRQWRLAMSILLWLATISSGANLTAWMLGSWGYL